MPTDQIFTKRTCLLFTLTIGLICCHKSPDNAKRLKVTLESKKLMFDLSSDLQGFVTLNRNSATQWGQQLFEEMFYSKASLYAIIVSQKNVTQIKIAQIEISVTHCGVILSTIALKEVSVTYCSVTLKNSTSILGTIENSLLTKLALIGIT